jgi:hypothetical protein
MQTLCMGCGNADEAPKHRLIVLATGEEVAWHHDCHVRTDAGKDCEICRPVLEAYPDLKDAELGAALVDNFPNLEGVNQPHHPYVPEEASA